MLIIPLSSIFAFSKPIYMFDQHPSTMRRIKSCRCSVSSHKTYQIYYALDLCCAFAFLELRHFNFINLGLRNVKSKSRLGGCLIVTSLQSCLCTVTARLLCFYVSLNSLVVKYFPVKILPVIIFFVVETLSSIMMLQGKKTHCKIILIVSPTFDKHLVLAQVLPHDVQHSRCNFLF